MILAWLFPLALIAYYRFVRVPARLQEIKASLLNADGVAAGRELPARHYVRLFVTLRDKDPAATKPVAAMTPDDLEKKIEAQFNQYHGGWLYLACGLGVALTSAFALVAIRTPPGELLRLEGWDPKEATAYGVRAIWALAGAYVWSLYEIFMRQSTCDLTPEELLAVIVRYLVAIPLGLAVSFLFDLGEAAKLANVANGVAFTLSAFPLNEVRRMFRQRALKKLGEDTRAYANPTREALLSETVDGLSLETLARLGELQITTYTDLAYADPLRIMAKTGYSLRHVIQWTDHALLAIYAPKHKRALRDAGLPCALDVKEFYEAHFADVKKTPWENRADHGCHAIEEVSHLVKLEPPVLNEIFQRVSADPHVRFIATLWYTGFLPKDFPDLPVCGQHVPGAPAAPRAARVRRQPKPASS